MVFGKLAHYALLWVLPVVAHGFGAVLPAALAYTAMQASGAVAVHVCVSTTCSQAGVGRQLCMRL